MPPTAARSRSEEPTPIRPVDEVTPTSIRWEDPPHSGRRSILEELTPQLNTVRTRPNTWARIKDYSRASSASTAAKKLRDKPPPGRWEFTGARTETGSSLYARFLGE